MAAKKKAKTKLTGKEKETVSKKVKTVMGEYKKTGKTAKGHKPKSKKAAIKQAVAIGYAEAGKSKPKKKQAKKKVVKEATGIVGFINSVFGKKFSDANKYLKAIIEEKIKARIANSLNKPLF